MKSFNFSNFFSSSITLPSILKPLLATALLASLFEERILLSEIKSNGHLISDHKHISEIEINEALNELENVNAYLYSIEALMERIFEIKLPQNIELKFKEISKELAPDPLNVDRLILNRLFHQTPDLPDNTKTN